MNWSLLKEMKCPSCSMPLNNKAETIGYKCACGFYITYEKFRTIVNSLYNPTKIIESVDTQERNRNWLNEL